MTGTQQRAALQSQIWKIANEVRGAVDGWDFKQYVLGALFYRFISENFASYIEADDDSVQYAEMLDKVITPAIKDDAIKTKGYFIYPSQLFVNVVKNVGDNESLNTDLAAIFKAIESSANGYDSEDDIKGLFADFDTTSNRLGNTVADKNTRLAAVLNGVAGLDFGADFYAESHGSQIDLFGDAYEFLISNYAANAGKSGGEFFTPQHVSRLIAKLALHQQTSVNKIYDPACGSGSLLLQAKKRFDEHIIAEGFFGQEINHTTYNLARMNMFLHNINYDKFNIKLGNTLLDPHFLDDEKFDAIVSNPPYSLNWKGDEDPTLINDDRFAPAGVLAPKSKADFAFVLHALHYLSSRGRAAIVCFPGIFYRGGAEQKIRKYLVDNNDVETVISLAPNLFFGTTKEADKKEFSRIFGEFLRVEHVLQNYDEFAALTALQYLNLADPAAVEDFKARHHLSDEQLQQLQGIHVPAERTIQDYRSTYNDIREWLRREKTAKEQETSTVDWNDVVFEIDLLKSQEINLDYILGLIFDNNRKTQDKSALLEDVRRVIRASVGNRAKEGLVVDFINQTDLDQIGDKASIIDAFFAFAQTEQRREAEELITTEKLNADAAKRYITMSLKREFASQNGTELNAVLPKMSPLNPQYLTKKQGVFQKIAAFIDKFKGVGGSL